jgi:hypothetical protein
MNEPLKPMALVRFPTQIPTLMQSFVTDILLVVGCRNGYEETKTKGAQI